MTAVVGFIYMLVQRRRVKRRADFLSRVTGLQFLFGLTVFPLMLMVGSLFSDVFLEELVATNRVLLCGAGFLSLFTLLENKSR